MGKTEDGAIWLSEDKLDVTSFWQYWRNTSDDDVIKFLYLFTELENKEIEKLKELKAKNSITQKYYLLMKLQNYVIMKKKQKKQKRSKVNSLV